uniref:Uncharacterized protein n=1 Tax=Engystomops pustulosus TaxID=76066 RepID=A0AAV6YLR1_ENGPU|nr:hypothetical protein GDO81_023309 [Engystomops pustulosus]
MDCYTLTTDTVSSDARTTSLAATQVMVFKVFNARKSKVILCLGCGDGEQIYMSTLEGRCLALTIPILASEGIKVNVDPCNAITAVPVTSAQMTSQEKKNYFESSQFQGGDTDIRSATCSSQGLYFYIYNFLRLLCYILEENNNPGNVMKGSAHNNLPTVTIRSLHPKDCVTNPSTG